MCLSSSWATRTLPDAETVILQVALTEEGSLMAAGRSQYGHFANEQELSHADLKTWHPWHAMPKFEGESVLAAACSDFHGVAVLENRRVYTWGVNCVFNAGDDYCDGVLLGYNTSDKGVDRGLVMPEKAHPNPNSRHRYRSHRTYSL